MKEIRSALIRLASESPEIRSTVLPLVKKADQWKSMPKGWTDQSRKEFWESLTGDNKHKVTKCIKEMDGNMDDPGAFCASLADRVDPGWRKRTAAEEPASEHELDALGKKIEIGEKNLQLHGVGQNFLVANKAKWRKMTGFEYPKRGKSASAAKAVPASSIQKGDRLGKDNPREVAKITKDGSDLVFHFKNGEVGRVKPTQKVYLNRPTSAQGYLDRFQEWAKSKEASNDELRSKLVHLAHSKPELRSEILPLLVKEASTPEVKLIGEVEDAFAKISYQMTRALTNLSHAKTMFKDDEALAKATETFYKELSAVVKTISTEKDKFWTVVADAADRGFLKQAGFISGDLRSMQRNTVQVASTLHTEAQGAKTEEQLLDAVAVALDELRQIHSGD